MSDALTLLADLVRIPSVNPPGDGEGQVAELLRAPMDAAGLDTQILTSPAGRPSLVARLPGPTDRPPLVLVSHTDVVPVEEEHWSRDPFGGEVADGFLWGRGTLDMKGIALMHVLAAIRLAASDPTLTREVVVVAVADEEAGGAEGAEWLVRDHGDLVGFREGAPPPEALGEGAFGLSGLLARPVMPIVVGERAPLGIRARATGSPGHGSLPPADQAIRSLSQFVEKVAGHGTPRIHPVMRELFAGLAEAADGPTARLLSVLAGPGGPVAVRALAPVLRQRLGAVGMLLADSLTPTMLEAGYKFNVIPGAAAATFDCRLLPDTDPDRVLASLRRTGAGLGVEVEELHRWSSPVSPKGGLFDLLADVSSRLPAAPLPAASLTPGTTDLRFFRARGATAYGWVPLVLTPDLVATFHGHDERIPVDQFDGAVDAMAEVVAAAST
jgi:acetylornithine deacetylase/succinyl-diaminopimelate desuccinylase-like protein